MLRPGTQGTMALERLWTRPDLSCGTSIPLISTNGKSSAAYCMGKLKRNGWLQLTQRQT